MLALDFEDEESQEIFKELKRNLSDNPGKAKRKL